MAMAAPAPALQGAGQHAVKDHEQHRAIEKHEEDFINRAADGEAAGPILEQQQSDPGGHQGQARRGIQRDGYAAPNHIRRVCRDGFQSASIEARTELKEGLAAGTSGPSNMVDSNTPPSPSNPIPMFKIPKMVTETGRSRIIFYFGNHVEAAIHFR